MATTNKYYGLGCAKRLPIIAAFLVMGCATKITGNLQSLKGTPVYSTEARVNIVNLTNIKEEPQSLSVNKDGSFSTEEKIANGQYMVEALVPGYKPMSIKIRVDKTENILLKLSPSKNLKSNTFKYHDALDESRGQGGATLIPPANF
jgi:hypothetical protein